MRVLVTGGSGFIGSSLVPALAARGHELRAAPAGCDAVVHLANIAHARASAAELQRVNVDGTRALAQRAAREGVRRFIYVSSIKAAAPADAYGRAKLEAETGLAAISNLEVVVLRPALVYGPGVKANFLALMRAIDRGWPLPFASIRNRRSLIFVGNLCDAIALCLESKAAAGKTFAVADGEAISTPALCRAIGDSLGRPARLFSFPPALLPIESLKSSLVVDDATLRGLGWRPRFTLEQGLRATADWYRSR